MPQNQQVNDELDGNLILVRPRPCRHRLHKIRHAKGLRETKQPHYLLRFQRRNVSIVNASKAIGAHRAVIRPLHEVENERNSQNRDHDHEPILVPAQ